MTRVRAGVRNQQEVTDAVTAGGVIAVLRASTPTHLPAVAEVLVASGIPTIEVTLTTPDAVHLIRQLRTLLGTAATVGGGTVLTADEAEACIDAGAEFLVSPAMTPDVVATARIAGVAAYPGAFTPTEILAAHRSGVAGVKLFPASLAGPDYLRDIHAPLPEVAIMPTGGIGLDEVEEWLTAGAVAVGLGSALCGRACEDGVDDGLRARARRAVAGVREAREG